MKTLVYSKLMIEVESGFIITPEQEEKLIEGADFLGEKKFTDVYYDDEEYSLTTKDIWLRKRDDKFELKVSLNKSIEKRVSDQYEELDNETDILKYFGADTIRLFGDFLKERGYKPFCEITTMRRKYKKDGFNIDLDTVNFGYEILEIELMVSGSSKMDEATQSIIKFAEKHNITKEEEWGKVIEYVRRNNPEHFKALVDAKIIKQP